MTDQESSERSDLFRRDVLRKGVFVAGVTAVGLPTLAGTAAASEPELCPKTPGFWKTHYPLDWPVKSGLNADECDYTINLGGTAYTPEQIFANVFDPKPKGDKGIIMAYQLAAAALNFNASKTAARWDELGNCQNFPDGAPDSLEAVYLAANKWLSESSFPTGKTTEWGTVDYGGDTWDAEALKDALDKFNNDNLCDCGAIVSEEDQTHPANPNPGPDEFPDC